MLQHSDDLDPFKVEQICLTFLRAKDLKRFGRKYQEVKEAWWEERGRQNSTLAVNRAPDPALPISSAVGNPPIVRNKARLVEKPYGSLTIKDQ